MTDEVLNDVLSRVPMTRRKFVRRVVMGSAFAVPFVASFDMRSLNASAKASNDCFLFNQDNSVSDGTYTLVAFNTATSPTPKKVELGLYVLQNGVNVSSHQLPVTLVDYTLVVSLSDGQTEEQRDLNIHIPKRLKFRASTTIHPPGYYELTIDTTPLTQDVFSEYYNGSFYSTSLGLYFTVGDDPNVLVMPGNYDPNNLLGGMIFASGGLCQGAP